MTDEDMFFFLKWMEKWKKQISKDKKNEENNE